MAHNIANINGRASFVSKKEMAWHELGTVVDSMTSAECIKLAGLDYKVESAPIYMDRFVNREDKEFDPLIITDKYATFRTDTMDIFGVVGSKYEIVQNTQGFDFFDDIVGNKEAIYETAGALGRGEVIFITAKLPESIHVKGVDTVNNYLLFTMSHDGTSSIQAMFTPIRVVCNNTLQSALSGTKYNKVTIRHTVSAHEKLKTAAKVMQMSKNNIKETAEAYNYLASIELSDKERMMYFCKTLLTKQELQDLAIYGKITARKPDGKTVASTQTINTIKSINEYSFEGPGQDIAGTRNTIFSAYNAITGYFQNVKTYKTAESKFNSVFNGSGNTIMEKALAIGLKNQFTL